MTFKNFKYYLNKFFHWFLAWDLGTCIFALAFFLTFIAFNVMWCIWTTFTPFSHFPLYVSTLLMTLLLTLPYAIWRYKWVEVLLLVLLDFLLLANLMYARTYFNVIPLSSYTNAGNLADFMPSVWASIKLADIVFPIITLTTIYFLYRFRTRIAASKPTRKSAYLTALGILLLVTVINFPTPTHFKKQFEIVSNNCYSYRSAPVMYSIFGSLVYNILVSYEKLSPEQEAAAMKFLQELPPIEKLPEDVQAPQNLVIIFCESLESWVIDTDYNGQQITPNLNALIKEKTTFYDPNVLSQVRDGRSIDGQLLCLTGLYPLKHGTYATRFPDNYYPSIHKALKQAHNSRAILMTGDKEYAWNQGHIGRNMGVDTIISFKDFRIEDSFTGRKHIGDRALMKQCAEKLKKGDLWPEGSPAFLQMVTYSGHGPFLLPDSEKKIKIAPGTPEIMASYINTAHYTDEALGIMVNYLKSRKDWDKTMVVITGDHEGLASWRNECLDSEEGRKYVSKEQFVPLIILNSPLPGRCNKVMGQVDIFSTLLHLLGLANNEWRGLGISVLSDRHQGVAISPDRKLVKSPSDSITVSSIFTNFLIEANCVSDKIIRYNLLRPSGKKQKGNVK